jgi:hypothetical protein
LQEILTFSAPGQSATLLLLHRQDQLHQQDCMQTLLVTQKYLQGGMQQQEQRVCLVSFY